MYNIGFVFWLRLSICVFWCFCWLFRTIRRWNISLFINGFEVLRFVVNHNIFSHDAVVETPQEESNANVVTVFVFYFTFGKIIHSIKFQVVLKLFGVAFTVEKAVYCVIIKLFVTSKVLQLFANCVQLLLLWVEAFNHDIITLFKNVSKERGKDIFIDIIFVNLFI